MVCQVDKPEGVSGAACRWLGRARGFARRIGGVRCGGTDWTGRANGRGTSHAAAVGRHLDPRCRPVSGAPRPTMGASRAGQCPARVLRRCEPLSGLFGIRHPLSCCWTSPPTTATPTPTLAQRNAVALSRDDDPPIARPLAIAILEDGGGSGTSYAGRVPPISQHHPARWRTSRTKARAAPWEPPGSAPARPVVPCDRRSAADLSTPRSNAARPHGEPSSCQTPLPRPRVAARRLPTTPFAS